MSRRIPRSGVLGLGAVLLMTACNSAASPPPSTASAATGTATTRASASPARPSASAAVSPSVAAFTGVITADPAEVEVGEPVTIRLAGFPPGRPVTVRATTVGLAFPDLEDQGTIRESEATFQADGAGAVDLTTQAPVSGSYAIVDGMGLFWSMGVVAKATHPITAAPPPTSPDPNVFLQYRTQLAAEVDGTPVATTTVDQDLGSPRVTMTEISEGGVLGQFYLPPGAGPFPAVIVLSGSQGGLTLRRPKILAADGYAVLALPYFNYTSPIDGTTLPTETIELPLEYFGKAIDWLQAQPAVDPERIGMYGTSLGGQVAMLVGARYRAIKAVIAISPPTVTWDGGPGHSSFSFKGRSVPYVVPVPFEAQAQPFWDAVAAGQPYEPTIAPIVATMKADPAVAAAIIQVEKINGPILIVSGTEDTQLPGVVYGALAMDRLATHHFAFPYRHIVGEGAGHLIDVPYVDRSDEVAQGGGSPQANELAGEAMWPVVLHDLAAMR